MGKVTFGNELRQIRRGDLMGVGVWVSSGSAPLVTVMESTDLRYRYHPPQFRRLSQPRFRRVLCQRQMRPRSMVVSKIQRQGSTKGGFVEDNHVVQALAPNGADHALHVGPLPRRSRSGQHFLNVHILYLLSEGFSEDPI